MATGDVKAGQAAQKSGGASPAVSAADEKETEIKRAETASLVKTQLDETFAKMIEAKTLALKNADTTEKREAAWFALRAVEDLQMELHKVVQRGDMAQRILARQQPS